MPETLTPKQKERMQKLVDALRSGEYEQTQNRLKFKNTYCCLGVACELFRQDQKEAEWLNDYFVRYLNDEIQYQEAGVLPPEIISYYGFQDEWGTSLYEGILTPLSELNDNGVLFPDIADVIEENYLKD